MEKKLELRECPDHFHQNRELKENRGDGGGNSAMLDAPSSSSMVEIYSKNNESGPLKILLVEDNPEHSHIITRYLSRAGLPMLQVKHASQLKEAMHVLVQSTHKSQKNIDVILLDLGLPDSVGRQTLRCMSTIASHIPIIVISTFEDREMAIGAVHEGAQDFLFKGELSSGLLARVIFSAIERKKNELRLKEQMLQKKALLDMGQFALRENNLLALQEKTVAYLLEVLQVDAVRIMEFDLKNNRFNMITCIGDDGLADDEITALHGLLDIQGRYLLTLNHVKNSFGHPGELEPVVSSDLAGDKRPNFPQILQQMGIKSGMSAVIYGERDDVPFGVLFAHSKERRTFSKMEADFLQAMCNTLAASILRNNLNEEIKKVNQQLELRVQELNNAHQRKDEFLATLSHELRTPLNVILGHTSLLKDKVLGGEFGGPIHEISKDLDIIERHTRIESQLVEDVLEVSRIITGKMNLNMRYFNIEEVIQTMCDSLIINVKSRQLSLTFEHALVFQPIYGDEDRFRQVIWNLISNALKFTPSGGKIVISVHLNQQNLMVSVQDSGKGIEKSNLPFVFDRFWQEETSQNHNNSGLGIGLFIVQQIVELHGGKVWVKSDGKDRGATFIFTMPMGLPNNKLLLPQVDLLLLQQQQQYPMHNKNFADFFAREHFASSSSFSSSSGPGPSSNTLAAVKVKSISTSSNNSLETKALPDIALAKNKLKDIRIVVIDDHEDNLFLLKRILEREGAHVHEFNSPEKGLFFLSENRGEFDLLISDIGMPVINGHILIKKVRSEEQDMHLPPIPAIALTAYAGEGDALLAQKSGFNKHLSKPVERTDLVASILELAGSILRGE